MVPLLTLLSRFSCVQLIVAVVVAAMRGPTCVTGAQTGVVLMHVGYAASKCISHSPRSQCTLCRFGRGSRGISHKVGSHTSLGLFRCRYNRCCMRCVFVVYSWCIDCNVLVSSC